ncbi:hypothetical protein EAE96_001579 [Botrytis aclada]|nr:hypothetical protein EAE96_001579 [Botrytis aclada]
MATRKERFVKHGGLPEITERQGQRYRATIAAKTDEERQCPIDMQKAWYAGRTDEEKAVTRKRKAETVALKLEEEGKGEENGGENQEDEPRGLESFFGVDCLTKKATATAAENRRRGSGEAAGRQRGGSGEAAERQMRGRGGKR